MPGQDLDQRGEDEAEDLLVAIEQEIFEMGDAEAQFEEEKMEV